LTDDPGDEPITTPKLNCGALEKLLGFFDSFAVVLANEAPIPNKMVLGTDEIGPVILHVVVRMVGWQKATLKRQALIRAFTQASLPIGPN
jgi:hypothetical protein